MSNPRIVFFGNSTYSVIDEKSIYERFGLSVVVTIPDQVRRYEPAKESPVKTFATMHKIPVIEAEKLTDGIIDRIKGYKPDFLVVADYGLILPKALLSLPVYASLNVHHSLLPKYRGPAPAPAAILNGDEESGVSVIVMTNKVDAGDILMQASYKLTPDETTDSLLTQLNILGSQAAIKAIEEYLSGTIHPIKQDEAKATFTKYMTKKDGLIDLSDDPELNWRKIRAFGDWPGTFFIVKHGNKDIRVKIKDAAFKDGVLRIQRVIPENKKEVSYEDFLRGLRA